MLYFKFNDEKLVGKTYHLRELVVGVNQYLKLKKEPSNSCKLKGQQVSEPAYLTLVERGLLEP